MSLQEKLKNAKETSWPGEDLPKWKLWLYCKWGLLKGRIILLKWRLFRGITIKIALWKSEREKLKERKRNEDM